MSTLTVIVGYCGSGKTHHLNELAAANPNLVTLNEGFFEPMNPADHEGRARLLEALRQKQDCATTSMFCCESGNRDRYERQTKEAVPGTDILWVFYENDQATADHNCQIRQQLHPVEHTDAAGNILQNAAWAPHYSIPSEAVILKMHRLGI